MNMDCFILTETHLHEHAGHAQRVSSRLEKLIFFNYGRNEVRSAMPCTGWMYHGDGLRRCGGFYVVPGLFSVRRRMIPNEFGGRGSGH